MSDAGICLIENFLGRRMGFVEEFLDGCINDQSINIFVFGCIPPFRQFLRPQPDLFTRLGESLSNAPSP
jgi:hypothetical protein